MLTDLAVISLPDIVILKFDAVNDLLIEVFSVQASISAISIAVVSIITGVTNDTLYGVSVSKYITSIKHRIFKHKTLIIASLVLIFLNYLFISYNLFNCVITSLLASIVINVILVNNVAIIFKGKDYVKNEIFQYIKGNYNEELIGNLNYVTIEAIETGNSLILKRNYEAYKAILKPLTEKAHQNKDSNELSLSIKHVSDSISDIFEKIIKTKDAYRINESISFICDIYDIANDNTASPLYLEIWDNISEAYYSGFESLSYAHLMDSSFWALRNKLYKNIASRTEKQLKGCNLRFYSYRLCKSLCSQTEKFSADEIRNIKRDIYDNAYYSVIYDNECISNSLNDICIIDICYLHKYLIDICDVQSISVM